MWKIAVGFIAFAALALWMLSKGGDIDIGGEKHDVSPPASEKAVEKTTEKAPGK
jgi:hypothetical protein